jgi:hypothetical protein
VFTVDRIRRGEQDLKNPECRVQVSWWIEKEREERLAHGAMAIGSDLQL